MEAKSRSSRQGQAFWLGHIVACEQAGKGVAAYLREHGLSEQNFYRWRKKLMLSGDLPVQVAEPMFQRLEVLTSSAVLEEESFPGCRAVLTGERARSPDAVQDIMNNCHIRLPNGATLELSGSLSTGLIGHVLQVVGAMPLMAERVVR